MLLLICAELPVVAGAVLPLMKKGPSRLRVIWTVGIVWLTSALAIALAFSGKAEMLRAFSGDEARSFSLGLDQPGRLLLLLIGVLCPPAVLFALEAMRDDPRRTAFFSWYLISFGALILMACAGNLLTLFLAFTVLAGLGLPLTGHTRDRDGFRAQRHYGRCVGIGWILALTAVVGFSLAGLGAFRWGGRSMRGADEWEKALCALAFLGFGALAGVLPLSGWMAEMTLAPAPVSALLHAMAGSAGVFAVMRVLFYTVSPLDLKGTWLQMALLALGVFTAVYSEIRMLRAGDVEMRLAWSSVGNYSFMLMGLALLNAEGLTAAGSHLLSHGLAKMALFFCTGIILERTGRTHAEEMHGLGKLLPWTFTAFTVAGLSLMGVPPLPGFVSKYALITAAFMEGGAWQHMGAFVMAASTVFTAADILMVVFPAFCMSSSLREGEALRDCGPRAKWALGILCALLAAASALAGPIMQELTKIGGGMGL